jgi:fucokinase
VQLPIGSGLGTSSILGATVVRALAVISGQELDNHALSEAVIQLEQHMTTGGGWQDQAGGIFPGVKLLITGPGLHQRIRVQPVEWSAPRRAEFCAHMVLYNTGLQRMAKDLLRQVVARYLARETAAVQVLHSIKTLAVEMSYAMAEGDWKHLGALLDRHWQLNQVLDPNTANAPINALLDRARPYIYGAKLAGAGGGGFLMLLARDPEAAEELRAALGQEASHRGAPVPYQIAEDGLRVRTWDKAAMSRVAADSGDSATVRTKN